MIASSSLFENNAWENTVVFMNHISRYDEFEVKNTSYSFLLNVNTYMEDFIKEGEGNKTMNLPW